MITPSPSELPRLSKCQRSITLPRADSTSEAATRGTTIHEFLANVSDRGMAVALELAPEDMRYQLASVDISRLPAYQPTLYTPEVSFAFNPFTGVGRILGRRLTREEARALSRPEEMVGTADVVGRDEVQVIIYDYKTGWLDVDPAEINWQIRSYALFACRALGLTKATVGIIRVLLNAGVYFDVAEMSPGDLLDHEMELRELVVSLNRTKQAFDEGREADLPPFHEGKWCRYCPSRHWCPTQKNMMVEVFNGAIPQGLTPLPKQLENIADPAVRYQLYERVKYAIAWAETFKANLEQGFRESPYEAPDGSLFTEQVTFSKSVIPERAGPVFERRFGPHVGKAVFSTSVQRKESLTQAALQKALLKHVIPTMQSEEAKYSASSLMREVMDDLNKAGAIRPTTRRCFKFKKPPKPALAGNVDSPTEISSESECVDDDSSEEP